jgi:hypothetical protein
MTGKCGKNSKNVYKGLEISYICLCDSDKKRPTMVSSATVSLFCLYFSFMNYFLIEVGRLILLKQSSQDLFLHALAGVHFILCLCTEICRSLDIS